MKTEIRYKLLESAHWIHYPISPEQYFEPLDEDRSYAWDDVPRHLHAVDFLPIPRTEVSETALRIWDPHDHLRLTISTVFWNAGRNVIIQRLEEDFELLIVQFYLVGPPVICHTIRLNREADGRLLLEYVQLIETAAGDVPGPSQVLSLPAAAKTVAGNEPIEFRYRLVDSAEWRTHPMTPLVYYKPREPGAAPKWDDMPKYEHAAEYLPFPVEQVAETEVRLADEGGQWRRVVSEVLWNHGQNCIVKWVDERCTWLRIQVGIPEEHPTHHTICLLRNSDESGVLEHEVDIEGAGSERPVLIVRRRL
jgi:hypothetical protein